MLEKILAELRPVSFNYKVGTFFKPGGAIGQFQFLGDTVLEKQNLYLKIFCFSKIIVRLQNL